MEKNLLIIGNSQSSAGFRYPLIKALVQANFPVTISIQEDDQSLITKFQKTGANVCILPYARASFNPIKDAMFCFRLYSYLKKNKPSHLFLYNVKPVAYGSILAGILKVPNCYSLITGLGYAFTETESKKSLFKIISKKLVSVLYKTGLKNNKILFFQNPDDEELFKQHRFIPENQNTVQLAGSGVDVSFYSFQPTPTKKVSFLMLSRLLKEKGVLEYAAAAKTLKQKYPEINFQLAGDLDPNPSSITEQKILNWKSESNLDYIGFAQEVRKQLIDSSVYVLPSYREGCPNSVLEAMAIGRPIITTDTPGCRKTVIEGYNGYLVPIKNAEKLAEAMERFIINPELIPQMGKASRQLAEEKFDVRKVNAVIINKIKETSSIQ